MRVPTWAIIAAVAANSEGSPKGWKKIGRGTQGTVYGKGAWIIKVFNGSRGVDVPLDLLKRVWTRKITPDNLPKVGFVFGNVAVMRKLEPISWDEYDRLVFGPDKHKGFSSAIQRLEDEGYDVNDLSPDNVMTYRGRPILNDVV